MKEDEKERVEKIHARVVGMGVKRRQYPEEDILWLIRSWRDCDKERMILRDELKDTRQELEKRKK